MAAIAPRRSGARRVDAARARTSRALEKMGAHVFDAATHGMFVWADFGHDTNTIAARGAQEASCVRRQPVFADPAGEHLDARLAATCMNPTALRFLARAVRD